jgi:hypothetical protein
LVRPQRDGAALAESIVLAGSLAQRPRNGGHTWQILQYLLGLRRLGWNVIVVDRLEPDMSVDDEGRPCPVEESTNLAYFLDTMESFGADGSFALLYDRGSRVFGLSRKRLLELVRSSSLLLNIMGFLDDEEVLGQAQRRVFVDTDPGFGQMWQALGLAELFHGHDAYVTIGENIGRPECTIPTLGIDWITTPQPLVLEQWPAQPNGAGTTFTSIGAWRGPYDPIEYGGVTYGLRVHEFRRFLELPRLTGQAFELALDIDPSETRDLEALNAHGWQLVDPRAVALDPAAYREYIRRSKAEFMVAKGIYVQSRSGWFSERSICYLASGKPVLAQDTGLGDRYPTDEGLIAFRTLDEAVAGVDDISRNYARHSRTARAIAEEYFDSDKVLARLLDKLGVH